MVDTRIQEFDERESVPLGEVVAIFGASKARVGWALFFMLVVSVIAWICVLWIVVANLLGQLPFGPVGMAWLLALPILFALGFSLRILSIWRGRAWCLTVFSEGFILFSPSMFGRGRLDTVYWSEVTALVESRTEATLLNREIPFEARIIGSQNEMLVAPPDTVDDESKRKMFELIARYARKNGVQMQIIREQLAG